MIDRIGIEKRQTLIVDFLNPVNPVNPVKKMLDMNLTYFKQ